MSIDIKMTAALSERVRQLEQDMIALIEAFSEETGASVSGLSYETATRIVRGEAYREYHHPNRIHIDLTV